MDPVCPERLDLDPDPDLDQDPDPDPVCPERLDPDLVNIRSDPKPCPLVRLPRAFLLVKTCETRRLRRLRQTIKY